MCSVGEEDKTKKKRRTELLLNTPGACFLCLQDNEGDGGGPLEHLNGGIVNLGNICRYLKINECSLLSTSLQNDGGTAAGVVEDFNQQLSTISVNLCPKCLQLTEKLNDMIFQLEKTKLLANFHLLSFHKALEGNEEWEGSLEWSNLLGRMHANPANSFEAKLVQLLREETRNKSSKMLKEAEAAMPQVILTKCQAPPPPPPPSPPSSITSDHSSSPPIPPISSGSTPAMKCLLSQLVRMSAKSSKKPVSRRLYRCPYCSKVLTHSTFAVHLSCVHADKLLSPYFPPSRPPSEKTCRKVLFAHAVVKAAKLVSPSNPTAPRLGCHLCGITYSQGVQLKQHFLVSHTDKLCEAIKTFKAKSQKMEMPIKKIFKRVPPSGSPSAAVDQLLETLQQNSLIKKDSLEKGFKRYQCSFCGSQIIKARDFNRHLLSGHPDKILAQFTTTPSLDKLKNDNPNHFSLLCRKVLASQVTKAGKRPVSKRPVEGEAASYSTLRSVCCRLCSTTCSDKQSLKHHLLLYHITQLSEQLIQMVSMKIEPKKKRKTRSAKKTCTICQLTFYQDDKLQRHQARLHPDHLFLKCKPGWMGEEQFRGICSKVFGGEVKKATYGKPGDKVYKCGYCPVGKGTSYKGQVELTVHLVFQHRREMERKLMEELEDDKLEDAYYCGGDEDGGDQMVMEEEEYESEFDVKPDIEHEMLYPDTILDEPFSEEECDEKNDLASPSINMEVDGDDY